jgi:ribosome-associated translation inhibitor RaiA
MQIPAEIAFHNIDSIPWAEKEIRARIAKLEKIYERLITCRVRVDQRARNATGTIPPVVRIEMSVPGRNDLVVSHEPDHLQQKFQNPDLHNAINEAFRIAEDQLAEYKRQLDDHGREPFHEVESQALGQVADIDPDGDFGFIVTTPAACCIFTATVCSRASSTSSSAATRCTTRVPAQELRRARRGDLFVEHREHASYTKA